MRDTVRRLCLREAELSDCVRLAQLSSQLGYDVSIRQIEDRLTEAALEASTRVIVATCENDRVLGWTQVGEHRTLIDGAGVQIQALVVDEEARRSGVGKRLIEAACCWAKSRGHAEIAVKSNAIRKEAHEFYPSLGFRLKKTQHCYSLSL